MKMHKVIGTAVAAMSLGLAQAAVANNADEQTWSLMLEYVNAQTPEERHPNIAHIYAESDEWQNFDWEGVFGRNVTIIQGDYMADIFLEKRDGNAQWSHHPLHQERWNRVMRAFGVSADVATSSTRAQYYNNLIPMVSDEAWDNYNKGWGDIWKGIALILGYYERSVFSGISDSAIVKDRVQLGENSPQVTNLHWASFVNLPKGELGEWGDLEESIYSWGGWDSTPSGKFYGTGLAFAATDRWFKSELYDQGLTGKPGLTPKDAFQFTSLQGATYSGKARGHLSALGEQFNLKQHADVKFTVNQDVTSMDMAVSYIRRNEPRYGGAYYFGVSRFDDIDISSGPSFLHKVVRSDDSVFKYVEGSFYNQGPNAAGRYQGIAGSFKDAIMHGAFVTTKD